MAPALKHIACFVVKEKMQRVRVNFGHTYAPTISNESLQLLVVLSKLLRFRLYRMDVKKAFLHGDIDCKVYVKLP
jgi:Reverse transcriptase (RNA-dependent DNA polymerase)